MIKNSSKQAGAIHVIIIGVVVVALIGALGFVFWQNFIRKDNAKKQESTAQTQAKPAEDNSIKPEQLTQTYTIPKENLSFNYPKTWELNTIYTNKDSNVGENRVLLTSSNNFALEIGVPSYGPNWEFGERPMACPFNQGYNGVVGDDNNRDEHPDACPFYEELMSEKVSNPGDLSIMAFESSYESNDISPDFSSLMLVKAGCQIPENNLCERPSAKTGFYLDVNGGYYENITDEDKNIALINTAHTNRKQIKGSDFLKSQDVITAIAILKSMRY